MPHEARGEARLADAWFAADEQRAAAARDGVLPRLAEHVQFFDAPHEQLVGTRPQRMRKLRAFVLVRRWVRHAGRDGFLDAFEEEVAGALPLESTPATGERTCDVGNKCLTGCGRGAQSACDDDRLAEHVAVFLGEVANGNPDPQLDVGDIAGEALARRHHVEPGRDAFGRASEGGEAPVAHCLDENAVVRGNGVIEPAEEQPPNRVRRVRSELGVETR